MELSFQLMEDLPHIVVYKMEQEALLKQIYNFGIVPVIALDNVDLASDLAKALCAGGLAIAEVTYRTQCAHDVIIEMKKACPKMLIGAGTVLTIEQVDSAIDAGASFIVSPGLNPTIVSYCLAKHFLIIPGCATPSDLEKALELGLTTVKFFPAEANGGIRSIMAMSAPYHTLTFMPTGGINEHNLSDYLKSDKIVACGGTWMVPKDVIEKKAFHEIERLTRSAISSMLNVKLAHVGINAQDESDSCASLLHTLTQNDLDTRSASIFVGEIELMKKPEYGTYGHLAYSVSNLERAIFYFTQAGFSFDEKSVKRDTKGHVTFVYLKEELHGFAIHLVKEG